MHCSIRLGPSGQRAALWRDHTLKELADREFAVIDARVCARSVIPGMALVMPEPRIMRPQVPTVIEFTEANAAIVDTCEIVRIK